MTLYGDIALERTIVVVYGITTLEAAHVVRRAEYCISMGSSYWSQRQFSSSPILQSACRYAVQVLLAKAGKTVW